MLSDYCREIVSKYSIIVQLAVSKNLHQICAIKRICSSLEKLKVTLQLGMKLKKIHRVLASKQSQFLKPYIDFNTE